MRVESSIMTSLSELRAIEQQRIADERAARERQRLAEIEARRVAEQARIAAEQARLRAEREERLRIEEARIEAERQARMRVEAEEAAERARLAAVLEQERLAQAAELRRAENAKKRPTWMVVVTGAALAIAVGVGWLAVDRAAQRDEAEAQRIAAVHATQEAKRKARQTREELERFSVQLAELDARVEKAEQVLLAAQTRADRERAAAEIAAANRQRAEIRRKQAEAERRRFEEERKRELDASNCLTQSSGTLDCIDGVARKKRN